MVFEGPWWANVTVLKSQPTVKPPYKTEAYSPSTTDKAWPGAQPVNGEL